MINLAMVGLGWWGRKMVDVVQGRSDVVRIARAVDPDAGAARPFAAERGLPLSADLAEVLGDPAVDAVVLATPHALHDEQIRLCAAAGKHVFCEKPLALTKADAERLVGLCRDAGLVLGMGHERRFEPPVAELLADVDAGRLGRILQIEANFSHDKFLSLDPTNWRLDPAHAPAGGMTATGIHLTDLATRILGPARAVTVDCGQLVVQAPVRRHDERLRAVPRRRAPPMCRPRSATLSSPASPSTAPTAGSRSATRRMSRRPTAGW